MELVVKKKGCHYSIIHDADLHIVQLMLLPLTVFASVKSRLVLPFWYRLTRLVPEKGPLNGCVSESVKLCGGNKSF